MNVLLGAYACLPNAGTEPGHGWNWAVSLVKRGMEVTVLTREDGRSQIEAYQRDHPNPNLKFVFVKVPGHFKARSVVHYILWHWSAVKAAQSLHRKRRFDIVHHVTYGSVHVPTQLWRLGVPTVFGPVGGGQTAPAHLLEYLGDSAPKEWLRTLFTKALPYSPLHRRWMRKMSAVFTVNIDTANLVRAMGRSDVKQLFDIGVAEGFLSPQPPRLSETSPTLRLLWVGRILPRKGLPIALDALAQVQCSATLTIVGESPDAESLRRNIAKRGLTDRIYWAGKRLPWPEVREAYLQHDALLFTSVRETCGAQLLESMALGLPVITLDLHGAKDLIPFDAGIKVPATSAAVAGELAAAIDDFARLPVEKRREMQTAAWKFAGQNTWSERAEQAACVYEEILGKALVLSSQSRASSA